MSYDIIYDRQFVQLDENNYIPMLKSGSNNCYKYTYNGKERRVREWHSFNYLCEGFLYSTENQMLERMYADRQTYLDRGEDYDDSRYGWFAALALVGKHTSDFTFRQYTNIVKLGVKKSLTLDELSEVGVSVVLNRWEKGIAKRVKTITNFEDIENQPSGNYFITFEGIWESRDGKRSNLKDAISFKYPKNIKEKTVVEQDHYFTILIGGNYFAKGTKYGYKYSSTYPQKKYRSEKEAQTAINRLSKKTKGDWTIERIDSHYSFTVNK